MCVCSLNVAQVTHVSQALEAAHSKDPIEVRFIVVANTIFGDRLVLLGAPDELGAWCLDRGIGLTTTSETFPVWTATVRLPAQSGAEAAYKFAIARREGGLLWEEGPNRQLHLSGDSWMVARFGKTSVSCSTLARPLRSPSSFGCVVIWEAMCAETSFGDTLCVVGSSEELGAWDPAKGLVLSTEPTAFPHWHGASKLEAREGPVAYKLVILRSDGSMEWEDGAAHSLEPPRGDSDSPSALLCRATFSGTCKSGLRSTASLQDGVVDTLNDCTFCQGKHSNHQVGEDGSVCDDRSTDLPLNHSFSFSRLSTLEAEVPDHADLKFWAGAHRVAKTASRCEDAYFIGKCSLGVADGVGSMCYFESHGVSAAAYAADLMQLSESALQPPSRGAPEARAAEALAIAEQGATTYGAATALILEMSGGVAGVANLGDSGFMLIRGVGGAPQQQHQQRQQQPRELEVVARSTEQQHGWNWPYQLMRLPPSLTTSVTVNRRDTADDCESYQFCVYPGDLVLLFTDGFSDNLYDSEILDILEKELSNSDPAFIHQAEGPGLPSPERLAFSLTLAARKRSRDGMAQVPFCDAARQHGYKTLGGKIDDITVVAAWVVAES